jgi:hypothetical protein
MIGQRIGIEFPATGQLPHAGVVARPFACGAHRGDLTIERGIDGPGDDLRRLGAPVAGNARRGSLARETARQPVRCGVRRAQSRQLDQRGIEREARCDDARGGIGAQVRGRGVEHRGKCIQAREPGLAILHRGDGMARFQHVGNNAIGPGKLADRIGCSRRAATGRLAELIARAELRDLTVEVEQDGAIDARSLRQRRRIYCVQPRHIAGGPTHPFAPRLARPGIELCAQTRARTGIDAVDRRRFGEALELLVPEQVGQRCKLNLGPVHGPGEASDGDRTGKPCRAAEEFSPAELCAHLPPSA